MRTSKYINISIIFVATLLFTQCEVQRMGCTDGDALNYDVSADIDDGSCVYDGEGTGCTDPYASNYDADAIYDDGSCEYDSDTVYCEPDYEGNLVIKNTTSNNLYLYKDGELITCIPANDTSFLVNIANPDLEVYNLQILKAEDVTDISDPDLTLVYRQWRVALSDNTDVDERATWLISGSDDYAGTGTIIFSYPDVDEYGQDVIYQVDIYLNSKTGAKLASLSPGVSDKKVNVNYGVHVLYFNYWYSDPDSPDDDYVELGWSEEANVVLNAEHDEADFEIPSFESNTGKYGYLKVTNQLSSPVSIYANGVLIENIVKTTDVTDALSIIPSDDYTEFLIPVDEDYTITAKSIDASKTYATFSNINILLNEVSNITVSEDLKSISIENNTSLILGVFTFDEDFLGLISEPGTTLEKSLISAEYDSLILMDFERTKKVKVAAENSIVIDSVGDYYINELKITNAWTVVDGSYVSDTTLTHNQSSVMKATLIIASTTTFSFDYKVSSEENFDVFKFSIDDKTAAITASGETGWLSYSESFEPGEYELVWTYTKDYDVSQGNDRVLIKDLQVE